MKEHLGIGFDASSNQIQSPGVFHTKKRLHSASLNRNFSRVLPGSRDALHDLNGSLNGAGAASGLGPRLLNKYLNDPDELGAPALELSRQIGQKNVVDDVKYFNMSK